MEKKKKKELGQHRKTLRRMEEVQYKECGAEIGFIEALQSLEKKPLEAARTGGEPEGNPT